MREVTVPRGECVMILKGRPKKALIIPMIRLLHSGCRFLKIRMYFDSNYRYLNASVSHPESSWLLHRLPNKYGMSALLQKLEYVVDF